MAVTIVSTPKQFSPSDNPLTFTFTSTQTAQANFSYIVETYFNAVKVGEDRVFPESGIYAHYDCSPIILSLMPLPQFSTELWADSATSGVVHIKVIENYGTPPTNQGNATSASIDVFKAGLSDEDWEDFDAPTDWKNLLFLTNFPRSERWEMVRGSDLYLNMITDASKTLEIKLYDSNNVLLDSYTDTQTFVIAQVNLNSNLLESIAGFSSGDIESASYVTVQIGTSEIITIHFFEEDCDDSNTIMWLNDYGAYDSFVFAHNLDVSGSVTDRKFTKQFGGWNGSNFEYDASNSGEQRVGTQTKKQGTIYTDWITQSQQNWLVSLYDSPQYRLYDFDGNYSSIVLTSTQFTFKKQRFEELINESVSFNYSFNKTSLSR